MSEYFNATVNELIADLTVAHVSSWQKWAIADRTGRSNPQAFHYNVDLANPAAPRITWAPNSALLAQFFRYVRMGAVRIGARSPEADVVPVAFVNPDGTQVVVVKTRGRDGGAWTVAIAGLAAGQYGVRTTTYAGTATDLPDVTPAADGSADRDAGRGHHHLPWQGRRAAFRSHTPRRVSPRRRGITTSSPALRKKSSSWTMGRSTAGRARAGSSVPMRRGLHRGFPCAASSAPPSG